MRKRTLLGLLGAGLIYAGCGEESSSHSNGKSDVEDAQQDTVDTYDTKEIYSTLECETRTETSEDAGDVTEETDTSPIKSCLDSDKDGFYGMMADEECYAPYGKDGDCNDKNKLIYPGASELCDGIDNDCNGMTDENIANQSYYTKAAETQGVGICTSGIKSCVNGAWEIITPEVTPATTELCDGKDNNCNGFLDEGQLLSTFYLDEDGDGFGDLSKSISGCTGVDNLIYFNGVKVTNYVTKDGDCDDSNSKINLNAIESCNAIDDNCNKQVDEGLEQVANCGFNNKGIKTTYCVNGSIIDKTPCVDPDKCKNGEAKACTTICGTGIETCVDGIYSGCTASLPTTEVCDGVDNNCNTFVDEGQAMNTFYLDDDEDGFGDLTKSIVGCTAADGSIYSSGIKQIKNYVDGDGDCNDTNAGINPSAVELCNGIDDNCDNLIDNGSGVAPNTFYLDADKDGYGTSDTKVEACVAPAGYVNNNTDCNDTNAIVNPAAKEVCNAIDENCDGIVDNGLELVVKCGYNSNGTKTTYCSNGTISDKTICVDSDECKLGTLKDCEINGVTYTNLPKMKCGLDAVTSTYKFKSTGSESTSKPDGLDNNCNGIVDETFFVQVPAGEYQVGCDFSECGYAGNPTHSVETSGFYISMFEFTKKQAGTSGNSPETNVTKAEADLFCKSLGGRLPTADEWEIAANGGNVENIYPWGTLAPTCNLTNYWGCSDKPAEAGSYLLDKSEVGAYDMGGNVSEWTSTLDGVFAIAKGGNWQDEAKYVFVYNEQPKDSTKGDTETGFRCVVDKIN